jgi:O-acetyl-ADP-ribose deacetylase (regulator of RNase III)
MIELVTGDMFTAHVDVLVDPTNSRGVSGAGLAKTFALKYPAVAQGYAKFCRDYFESNGKWPIGHCHIELLPKSDKPWAPKAVACLPTKDDWRKPSRPEYIRDGLTHLVQVMQESGYRSVAMPALGCGLGGLNMSVVKPHIDRAFFGTDLHVLLFASKADSSSLERSEPVRHEGHSRFEPVRPPALAKGGVA